MDHTVLSAIYFLTFYTTCVTLETISPLFYVKLIPIISFRFAILIITMHKHLTRDRKLIFDYPCPRIGGNPLARKHTVKGSPDCNLFLTRGIAALPPPPGSIEGPLGHNTHRQWSVFQPFSVLLPSHWALNISQYFFLTTQIMPLA